MKKLAIALTFMLSSLFIFNNLNTNAAFIDVDEFFEFSSIPVYYTTNILFDEDNEEILQEFRLSTTSQNAELMNTLALEGEEIYIKHNLPPQLKSIKIYDETNANIFEFTEFFGSRTAIIINQFDIEIDSSVYSTETPIDFYIVVTYKISDIVDTSNTYENGYEFGLIVGREEGRLEGYQEGFRNSETYWRGRFLAELDDTLKEEYDKGFNKGYSDGKAYGLSLGQEDAYNEGYNDGANESFLGNFDKWIVPAIIVVMFVGGFFAVVRMKRDNL